MTRSRLNIKIFFKRIFYLLNLKMIIKKPKLLLRAFKVAVIHLFTSKNMHWFSNLSVTNECNLNCQHCFAHKFSIIAEKDGKKQLSAEEYVGVIQELLNMGVFSFEFQGGEILLYPHLEEIIKACKPEQSFISLVTNGILFNDKIAMKLRKWGVDQINISIDSGIPEEHNKLRNYEGCWEKSTAAIDVAKKYGFKVMISTTVTKKSLYSKGFQKLRTFCRERNLVNWILIGIPVGNWFGRYDILIDKNDHEYLAKCAKDTNNMIRRDLSPHLFRIGCPAVKEGVYINSYGDVLPCPFIHISLGNVNQYRLKDIVDRALTIDKFKKHNPVCLIGEDKEFIDKYGQKTFTSPYILLDGEKEFGFSSLPRVF